MGKLAGQSILILEDGALAAMMLGQAFQEEGATVAACGTLAETLVAIEQGKFSAAVMGRVFCEQNPQLCQALDEKGILYILHDGLIEVHGEQSPATTDALIEQVEKLLRQPPSPKV